MTRAIAGSLATVLLAGPAVAAPADTKTKISDARRRLAALEKQISAQNARVLSVQKSMKAIAAKIGTGRRTFEAIQTRLVQTRTQHAQVETRYREIRAEIDEAAADAYMRGHFGLETLMSLDSISDAAYVVGYSNAIARRHSELAEQAQRLAAELRKKQDQETGLLSRQRAALTRLTADQADLTRVFADQQVRLATLSTARAEVGSLLAELREQLRAEEIAAARAAIDGGTPLSFERWARAFLSWIDAPVARNNLVVMIAWQAAEYTNARWNPLATTQYMPGSTTFNSSRVRNYISLRQGLEATLKTLSHDGYGYEAILSNLARNADPMTTAEAINASRWCRGCANGGYVVDLIDSVERYYDRYAKASA